MSIFGNIMSKIFGHPAAAQASPDAASGADAASGTTSGQMMAATPQAASGGAPTSGTTPSPVAPISSIDVAAVLTNIASQNKQKLDWRHSIVDLMKLLDLDSSLSARKQLAQELHYDGDTNDSASMNIWLHKQVMTKLAESGGKVPESLKG